MPFVSEKQRRLCWLLYTRNMKKGKKPSWDCHEWSRETGLKKLPMKRSSRRQTKRPTKRPTKKRV